MKAVFIDFDDSFSHNVIQELVQLGLVVRVIHWWEFVSIPSEDLIVLGPGPGNPNDYQIIFPLLKNLINQNKYFLGICLGHQIFWSLHGATISKSNRPMHGQKVSLTLDTYWKGLLKLHSPIKVQRYNSLAVTGLDSLDLKLGNSLFYNGELMMSHGSHFLTYQFHPESLGTSCRSHFFRPILNFKV